jgi:hypothetical protein
MYIYFSFINSMYVCSMYYVCMSFPHTYVCMYVCMYVCICYNYGRRTFLSWRLSRRILSHCLRKGSQTHRAVSLAVPVYHINMKLFEKQS